MSVFIQPPFWADRRQRATPHRYAVLVTPPTVEPLTLAEAKVRAGVDWVVGDPRDALLQSFIAAARSKVEHDTGLALLPQARDLYYDEIGGGILTLPDFTMPLASATIKWTSSAGVVTTIDPAQYIVDLAGGRIAWAVGAVLPSDLRAFQPWVIHCVSGWPTPAALKAEAPILVHLVGLLVAHYATLGRDFATIDPMTEVPGGYADQIQPYLPVSVA
jgi:uncharacterized phiE125 gp8 family phage protein